MRRILHDPTSLVRPEFYEFLRADGVAPEYGRFLREGMRRGDGAFEKSSVAQALGWLHREFPHTQSVLRLQRAMNITENRVEPDTVELPQRTSAPLFLRKLEIALKHHDRKSIGLSAVADPAVLRKPNITLSKLAEAVAFKMSQHQRYRLHRHRRVVPGDETNWRKGTPLDMADHLLDKLDDAARHSR